MYFSELITITFLNRIQYSKDTVIFSVLWHYCISILAQKGTLGQFYA